MFLPQDLTKVHHGFLRAVGASVMLGGGTLAKVFLDFKERCVQAALPAPPCPQGLRLYLGGSLALCGTCGPLSLPVN